MERNAANGHTGAADLALKNPAFDADVETGYPNIGKGHAGQVGDEGVTG